MSGATALLPERSWVPDVRGEILQMLDGPPGLAAFDFDNTLIYNDLGEAAMYYIAFQGMLRGNEPDFWAFLEDAQLTREELREMRSAWQRWDESDGSDRESYLGLCDLLLQSYGRVYARDGMEAAYRWSTLLFAWQPARELESIGRHVFAFERQLPIDMMRLPSGQELAQGIRPYTEIYDLIQAMKARDWTIRIVTASPREVIRPVIDYWGLDSAQVLGMKLARDGEILLPTIEEPMPFQKGKLEMLRDDVGDAPLLFSAGDSLGDRDMLLEAKTAIFIDRKRYPDLRDELTRAGVLLHPQFAVDGSGSDT